jgi:PilZ domain
MPSGRRLEQAYDAMAHDPEHRVHERRAVVVDVSAWSLAQPTVLLTGTTIDLGVGGARLRLPGLSQGAVRLELSLALPEQPLTVGAAIVRREPPDLVAVVFDPLAPSEVERLRGSIGGAT